MMITRHHNFPVLLPDYIPIPDDGIFDIFGNPYAGYQNLK